MWTHGARKLAEIDVRTPATIARKLSAISGFYRYAVNEDVIGRNPVAAVRQAEGGERHAVHRTRSRRAGLAHRCAREMTVPGLMPLSSCSA